MKFRAEHTFRDISIADYESLYFDEDFNTALCKEVKLARTLEKREVTDGRIVRAVRVGPDREIPKPVAKIIGASRIEYTEHIDYQLGSHKGKWHTISSLLTEKVDTRGTFEFREVSPTSVRRIIEGEITVKLFGVGKVVEKFIVSDIERSYADAARFTQQWIENKKG